MLTLALRRDVISGYGLSMYDVQSLVAGLVAGEKAGDLFDGDRRFDIVVRLKDDVRQDIESQKKIPVPLPSSAANTVLLGELVDFELAPSPSQISRENGKRRVVVTANVRGRDIGSYITEAQQIVSEQIVLPEGNWIGWGGTFEQMQSAKNRLLIVVPATLMMILMLLYAALGSIRNGLLVFSAVPLALTGGIIALALRGIPVSISAVVGFIALSGVAVLNGLVLISAIQRLIQENVSIEAAVYEGTLSRLRPVLITAFVAALGFIPMAFNVGIGAEVQRPIATVVIGGIISSTLLTLIILPVLYVWLNQRKSPPPAHDPLSN